MRKIKPLAMWVMFLLSGCAAAPQPEPHFVLQRQPDDVTIVVKNLRYDATVSGYTCSYDPVHPDEPCEPSKWLYIRKDALVGTCSVSACPPVEMEITRVWLRHGWEEADKPLAPGELEKIPHLPARHPARE